MTENLSSCDCNKQISDQIAKCQKVRVREMTRVEEECNDETEMMSVCQPENTPGNSESTKKSSGRKRKSVESEDPLVDLFGTYCRNTGPSCKEYDNTEDNPRNYQSDDIFSFTELHLINGVLTLVYCPYQSGDDLSRSSAHRWVIPLKETTLTGVLRESNSRPLAPEARIIPLDQTPSS
ncbi:hypothetical protein DH2020_003216 [Rehmannia glutinosa]|uniref:Uncharacterized protein n=1 Tax=Rehmannia glutinosa TaxID=99300 RepID=A0ABR0XKZ7_REHGL